MDREAGGRGAMYYYPFDSSRAATIFVGQVVNLRRVVNPPVGSLRNGRERRTDSPPQAASLPHIAQ
jgi:hypothetical protein